VATGWVSCAGLRDKRAQTVLAALRRLHEGLPFKLRGLHSGCGSEFLKTALVSYCADQHITFTRGRPYRKNDGCHVEQRNWAVVRRLVGYQRLESRGPACTGACARPRSRLCELSSIRFAE